MPRPTCLSPELLGVGPDVVIPAVAGRVRVRLEDPTQERTRAAPIGPVAQALVRGARICVERYVPGIGLGRYIQQVRDARVDPHDSHVVGPHLQEVTPRDAGILVEQPVEWGPGADAFGGVARHAGPVDPPTG